MTTLYQYTIKSDSEKTFLMGYKNKLPISCIYAPIESDPAISADLLRELAKWAIEQAEIIEELEGHKIPERKPFIKYKAELVEVVEETQKSA